nr:translation initiation factor IF-2-like isoform X1 [Procambarus clarkii]
MKVVLLAALLAVAAAQGTKPLTPGAAQGTKPLTPGAAQGTKPLTPGAAQGTKPLTPGAAQGTKPLTPGAAQGTRPLIPGTTQAKRPLTPGTAQRTRPPTPGTTQVSNVQSSKKPVDTRVGGGQFPGVGGLLPGVGGGFLPGVGGGFLPGVGGGLLPGGNVAQPATCRYWCKTPEGKNYCCETNDQHPSEPLGYGKVGICPIVRAECTRFGIVGPQTCAHDDACYGADKCCFDRCLEEHVCKTPIA